MDCTEPYVVAQGKPPDNTSINSEALEPPEIGKTSINVEALEPPDIDKSSINNGKAQEIPDIGNDISINDIGKTSENIEAEQVCHNVSVPLFTAKDYLAGLATQYDEIIDVRTPLEFEEDHIFGAVNLPVLSNEQRVQVGSLYHKDRMAGRKLGAALITANISKHILEHFTSKAGNYRPLVYCWRGGQRSRSMALILREIGFQAAIFQGGYKQYRQLVRETVQESELSNKIDEFKFILPSGNLPRRVQAVQTTCARNCAGVG